MEPPLKPCESDCCNSGCNPCILDVYEEQLRKYNERKFKNDFIYKANCISQTTYTIFKLIQIIQHTMESFLFTFKYTGNQNTEQSLVYRPGQHFLLKGYLSYDKSDQFTRAYTPIPLNQEDPLSFTVLIKLYENGIMSRFLKNLQLHSETLWRGPYGLYEINFGHRYVFMVAQGTGIAPLYSIIQEFLNNSDCDTFLKLFFCCRNKESILLRNELYNLSAYWNFHYEIFLSNCDLINTKYNEVIHVSRLQYNHILGYLQNKLDSNIQILICGSESFNNDMHCNVVNCGIDANQIFLL